MHYSVNNYREISIDDSDDGNMSSGVNIIIVYNG